MTCPVSAECWRFSYSRYWREIGYVEPPPRIEIFTAGFAAAPMMPRRGLFAESIPLPGRPEGMCPDLSGAGNSRCPEFATWAKRRASRARKEVPEARRFLPQALRREVAARARYKCAYCGRAHNSLLPDGRKCRCVVDHRVPLALGGDPLDPRNLLFACTECNSAKGAEIWEPGCRVKS